MSFRTVQTKEQKVRTKPLVYGIKSIKTQTYTITFAVNQTDVSFCFTNLWVFKYGDRLIHPIDLLFFVVLLPKSICVETIQNNQYILDLFRIDNTDEIMIREGDV